MLCFHKDIWKVTMDRRMSFFDANPEIINGYFAFGKRNERLGEEL